MIDYIKPIKKGILFALTPKRLLPMLALDIFFFALFIIFVFSNLPNFISALLVVVVDPTSASALIGDILFPIFLFLFLLVVWGLLRLMITGVMIHQSYRETTYRKSFNLVINRYPSLLLASIMITIVTGILNVIPYVGGILSLIAGIAFFFYMQFVILEKTGGIEALESSFSYFRRTPLEIFFMWILITLISLMIGLLFSIPLFLMIWPSISSLFAQSMNSNIVMASIILVLLKNSYILAIGGSLSAVGLSVSTVFSLKSQTEYYKILKRQH